ncbi:TPR domain-containing protein [Brachyspira hampsonii 30446]|uniref:TPR domain-containing protein n=3 Tax=Brachyspira hampsonii TaxID=1287055 RepID=A0A2U4F1E7_9SPIR|nr:tetratricopeptide repeat protein [Brachyspira hampsonii]EKV56087.1 TPR domain-containing protein [Brachyspira hampsonii 30446]OEJ18070.1 hypothetical protein A9495_06595 [Brachyspira hampsonii]
MSKINRNKYRNIKRQNIKRRKKYHKKNNNNNSQTIKNNKLKEFQENISNKAKEYINNENIKKIKDAAGKGFEKAKDFTSDNIDKFQKYIDEKDIKGKVKNITNAGIDKIKEHSKKKYITRFLKFIHRYYILTFLIIFIISILVFRNIYITHNEKIENSLNYSITNFAPSLNNIIIAKEDYYTNIIISKISSNKNITNNIILKSTSLDNLETSLKNILDNYNIRLQTSINETVKSSNNLINFWFAFLTVIIIVFTLITLVINNNILKKSKRKIKVFNNNYNKKVKEIKMHIKNFEKLKKENDKTIEINKLYNLANTLFDLKDYNNSIYYYDKVLELDNNFIYSIYNKAVSYYYINDYNKCTDNFIYLYNKESSIKDLALKNIIELANKNVEKAIQFCLSENIDYKSLQQNEEKISIFDRIRNILS